ncbi:SoxR reducing system RseC family protein [Thermodesulfobacteriota bacterium]
MATEEGVVTKIESTTAWVTTTKTGACESCAAKSSCTALGGGKEMEVKAINNAGARIGQKVVINFETSPLLKATFLLYVIPILFLLIGAFIGDKMGPHFKIDASILSAITGFLFLGIAILVVIFTGNRLAKKDEYQPKIIRIIKQP